MTMFYVQSPDDLRIHVDNGEGGGPLCGAEMSEGWKVRDETENGSFASCLTCRDKAGGK